MAKGKKTTPEDVYRIMAMWAITDNINETAKRLGMAESTVRKIVLEKKDEAEFKKLCAEKRIAFSEKADRVIEKAIKRLEKELDDEEKNIPVNHLTTVIGTLYDKKALADGSVTENVAIEIKLPPGAEEYAE